MRNLELAEVLQRGLRSKVCTQCYQRPFGSVVFTERVPRLCEVSCPIFKNLGILLDIDGRIDDTHMQPYEEAVRACVCEHCELARPAGEFCTKGFTRTCPLSRYLRDVLGVIEVVSKTQKSVPNA